MATDNSVTLVGNVTRDPELRFTNTGQANVTFGLAVNRRWQNRQTQEWEEATSFFDVVCWREMAENVSETITRGARVMVAGRLEQRSWETQDGERRSKVEVVADEIGPSLRWATAQIVKNERRGVGDSSGRGGGRGPAPAAESASGGGGAGGVGAGGGGGGAGGAGGGGYGYDEEPF
jgi:single-strand DNA-binding protein